MPLLTTSDTADNALLLDTGSIEDFELLYSSTVKKLDDLLSQAGDAALKACILKNVHEIRSWLPKQASDFNPNHRLHRPAVDALKTALSILKVIELFSEQNKYTITTTGVNSQSIMGHIFSGGHLLIEDDGAFLSQMQKHIQLVSRYSSHYKNEKIKAHMEQRSKETGKATMEAEALTIFNAEKPDYSTRAEVIFNELLIGKIRKNGKTYTWLQFEGHSHQSRTVYKNTLIQLLNDFLQLFHYSIEKFQHHLDFVHYLWHGKKQNIGQYGNSVYTESNPIQIECTEPVAELPIATVN